ncbi:5-formyltetrahydrofolate cyclo-ligase [Acinetobacter sp. NCu2D-2]|uniref:5-formyltetrahydrofolate cyclo-ligase n=1 Tax=Acinetobacter sp. NCu2D-2 TaxID=1608473 RepID=UPI0007CE038E|nr:5-formyltetrahydrofolate cyclo-ligase [Acinetobacter sp. NCu2D-2]ANF81392.1 5-formyltetrahydrofolate cyclo-ligase [Acinetobacter sp. NCu2D-2]
MQDLSLIRKTLRKKRRLLTTFDQRQAAQRVLSKLKQIPKFQHARSIGIYLDAFGEIQTQQIIEECFHLNKKVYLPLICNMNQQLVWIHITPSQYRNKRFAKHRLGMLEPMSTRGTHVSNLDLLLIPLLACDRLGSRIGMGGGFYDRTLAQAKRKPYRLGLAHHFQLSDTSFKRAPWDQALDGLITPEISLHFKR